jgi:chromosome segregation ATPase
MTDMPRLFSLFLFISISFAGVLSLFPLGPAAAATAKPQTGRSMDKEQRVERVKRFLQRTVEDLNLSRQLVEEDIDELEKQIDAIPPLEPLQREADLLSLLDTSYSYLDWLKDRIDEFEEDLGELSAETLPGSEFLGNSFAEMAAMLKEQEKVLQDKVSRFREEEKRLACILERRRLLQSQFNELQAQLARMEQELADREHKPAEEEKARAERIRIDLGVVQTELLSLPQVDEDILKHYAVLIERGRWSAESLTLKVNEYGMLREVAPFLPREPTPSAAEMEGAFQRAVRGYEKEINLLNRKIDELERMRSRITPAGTLRELDRSRELADFYERLQIRYNDLINRIRIRIGAWQAESAEVRSANP